MRMTSCKQCGDIISQKVETCENCGTTNVTKRDKSMLGMVTLLLPVLALLIIFRVMAA